MKIEEITELREKLAELAYEQWSGWMDYLFSKSVSKAGGACMIPSWAVKRWQRQMKAPSCVGCPTAEAMIESETVTVDPAACESVQEFVDKLNRVKSEKGKYITVLTERLVGLLHCSSLWIPTEYDNTDIAIKKIYEDEALAYFKGDDE